MTITYLGSLSIGDAIPGAAAVAIAGAAGINAALPDLQARLEALLAFSPAPVSFTAQVELGLQIVASAQLSISLGLPVPSILAQIAAVSVLVAELTVTAASISVQLGIITDFQLLLGAAGVHAYAYDGDVDQLGGELAAELAGGAPGGAPSDHANALVLLTSVPATWVAMSQIFQVTP